MMCKIVCCGSNLLGAAKYVEFTRSSKWQRVQQKRSPRAVCGAAKAGWCMKRKSVRYCGSNLFFREYWASEVFRRVLGKLNVFASIGRVKCLASIGRVKCFH